AASAAGEGLGGGATAPQEPGVLVEAVGAEQQDPGGTIQALQEELSAALAEVETLRAVATVSEDTKQEAVAAVRRQCQEEVASLQAILKDTISSYEARLEALQQEQHGGGSWGSRELSRLQQQQTQGNPLDSLEQQMEKAQEDSERLRSIVLPMEEEIAQLKSKLSRAEGLIQGLRRPEVRPGGGEPCGDEGSGPEGEEELGGGLAFTRGCDSVSIISIASSSAGSPRLCRRPSPEHEDTASLLSTGTLVPESIYLPPPGFRLVPDGEWAQLQQEVRRKQLVSRESRGGAWQVRETSVRVVWDGGGCWERDHGGGTSVSVGGIQSSAHPPPAPPGRLQSSHKRLSYELSGLSEENEGLRGSLSPTIAPQELQALVCRLQDEARTMRRASEHHSERLRIEIVTLRERLDEEEATRARLQGVLEAQLGAQREETSLCSVRSEMERLQQQLGQARLEAALSEQRGKLQRLQAELDTSEQVQRDFVRLSQTLQVQLERIRQAPSLEQVRSIVDGTRLKDVAELKEP
uniref:Rab GTPase-binding effector protein 2 n=1 Tax=Chelonoidis abingdonii TaxID=106734 RepID=A0A8C0GW99_CHEAB